MNIKLLLEVFERQWPVYEEGFLLWCARAVNSTLRCFLPLLTTSRLG
jgi:hypothetical protein